VLSSRKPQCSTPSSIRSAK